MFSFLIKFFSRANRQDNKKPETASKDLNHMIDESLKEFENRPLYKVLTSQIIDDTSDDDLLQVVFDNLIEKLPKDYEKCFDAVSSWTKPRQAIYIIWGLEAEVNNGGFNQYYFNPSGQFAALAPDALRLVGASKFADLADKANKVYKDNEAHITKYQDGTLEGFSKSYQDNPLDEFDSEFYAVADIENLSQLQIEFIRSHKSDFIDN